MKVHVFVSYCRKDISADDGRLRVFIDRLRAVGGGLYDVMVDSQHEAAAVGSDLDAYIRKIDTSDAVVILLTPGYKARVAEKGSTGVYAEFRRIYDRMLQADEKGTYGRTFLALPVLFTGVFDESCPNELRSRICCDLSWLYVKPRTAEPTVRREIRARLDHAVTDIGNRIAAVAATKRQGFRMKQGELLRQFLFQDTKSRWDDPANHKYLDLAFVKTAAFLRVRDGHASFVIGRKGAGKSTITHVLPVLSSPPPAQLLRLEFEQLPFEACFNILRAHPAEASDLRAAFSPIYSYQLLWDGFLHLFFAWAVRDNLPANSHSRRLFRRLVDKPTAAAKEPTEAFVMATRILFVFTFEQLVLYLDELVRRAPASHYLTDAVGRFSPSQFRERLLARQGWAEVDSILTGLQEAEERILVTADGFDTLRGYFTAEAGSGEEASRFERELLLALFQVVLNKGPARVAGGKLYQLTSFCIAIPHDRFMQIRASDSDRYQYRHRFSRIEWSGMELSALIRKRLALLRNIDDPAGNPLDERLRDVMRKGYPELPDEVSFQFGAAQYHLPLFIYVLRHTFWRPRDVLFYYAALLAAAEYFRKKGKEMPAGFVRQVIAGATRVIVEDELLDEFRTSFRSLREVLGTLRKGPQVLSWQALEAKLGEVRFDAPLALGEKATTEWKVERLYEVGVLGVVLDKRTSDRLSSCRHAFSFNEGELLTEKLGRDTYGQFHYAIHPVLCEYLHLDTSGNTELILAVDWKYLHDNEVLRGIAPA